jgi:cell migration-inducing and hyaluronan-binding protein
VQVTRAGQFKHLGRYPVHWHMAGDVAGQFIMDSAIHNNYQRALTVHATNSLSIFRNVAYKTRGHMFFLEGILF